MPGYRKSRFGSSWPPTARSYQPLPSPRFELRRDGSDDQRLTLAPRRRPRRGFVLEPDRPPAKPRGSVGFRSSAGSSRPLESQRVRRPPDRSRACSRALSTRPAFGRCQAALRFAPRTERLLLEPCVGGAYHRRGYRPAPSLAPLRSVILVAFARLAHRALGRRLRDRRRGPRPLSSPQPQQAQSSTSASRSR